VYISIYVAVLLVSNFRFSKQDTRVYIKGNLVRIAS